MSTYYIGCITDQIGGKEFSLEQNLLLGIAYWKKQEGIMSATTTSAADAVAVVPFVGSQSPQIAPVGGLQGRGLKSFKVPRNSGDNQGCCSCVLVASLAFATACFILAGRAFHRAGEIKDNEIRARDLNGDASLLVLVGWGAMALGILFHCCSRRS